MFYDIEGHKTEDKMVEADPTEKFIIHQGIEKMPTRYHDLHN